jgi:hypothetical protein
LDKVLGTPKDMRETMKKVKSQYDEVRKKELEE